jgi:hypothetical protein
MCRRFGVCRPASCEGGTVAVLLYSRTDIRPDLVPVVVIVVVEADVMTVPAVARAMGMQDGRLIGVMVSTLGAMLRCSQQVHLQPFPCLPVDEYVIYMSSASKLTH